MTALPSRRQELAAIIDDISRGLGEAHRAREVGLAACRRVIQASGSSIRAVHRQDDAAGSLADDAERALREAQEAVAPYPSLAYAGFLHDAEKEYAEARLTAAIVAGESLPEPEAIGVDPTSWLRGLAEAASELRRHLLDRLRAGDLGVGERLLAVMDDVYDVLMTIDYPDAVTNGLRRSVDGLRAVLERTRGDVTTTVLQSGLKDALDIAAQRLRRQAEFG
ncbi:MAG: haloacid dehalogenase [Acidimicrobiales bacterium]